jgi:hypothetical protein
VAMQENQLSGLGKCRILSFMPSMPFVDEDDCVLYDNLRIIQEYLEASKPRISLRRQAQQRKSIWIPPNRNAGS